MLKVILVVLVLAAIATALRYFAPGKRSTPQRRGRRSSPGGDDGGGDFGDSGGGD